jgi:DNA repair protein RecO (recombination protein O)
MTKVDLTPAFLIHRRAFKDTSLLLDFLTLEHGKIRLVGRGLRKSKTSIQVFQQLKISYRGKGELKSLSHWETHDVPRRLRGENLIFGIYANELISRLLLEGDPHPELFEIYKRFVANLSTINVENSQWLLRLFETNLLQELGYGVDFTSDEQGAQIDLNAKYEYRHQGGFSRSLMGKISGKSINQLLADDINNMPDTLQLRACRDLNRTRFKPLLGNKPLQSRTLFFSK